MTFRHTQTVGMMFAVCYIGDLCLRKPLILNMKVNPCSDIYTKDEILILVELKGGHFNHAVPLSDYKCYTYPWGRSQQPAPSFFLKKHASTIAYVGNIP